MKILFQLHSVLRQQIHRYEHLQALGLTYISAWISEYNNYKVWDEIIYQFLWSVIVEVWRRMSNFISYTTYSGCNYLSILCLKFTHVSKRGGVSLRRVHRPCMAMWNPDANWKWGRRSRPFLYAIATSHESLCLKSLAIGLFLQRMFRVTMTIMSKLCITEP